MELVVFVVTLALFQFIYFAIRVGNARRQYGIKAPAMSGHPVFERHLRVQQNTMEQLLLFVPASFLFAWQGEAAGWTVAPQIAAALGVIWLIGRGLYARAYVKEPLSRAVGFAMTIFPSMLMMGGTLLAVFMSLL